jgi:hypothetical protein
MYACRDVICNTGTKNVCCCYQYVTADAIFKYFYVINVVYYSSLDWHEQDNNYKH